MKRMTVKWCIVWYGHQKWFETLTDTLADIGVRGISAASYLDCIWDYDPIILAVYPYGECFSYKPRDILEVLCSIEDGANIFEGVDPKDDEEELRRALIYFSAKTEGWGSMCDYNPK